MKKLLALLTITFVIISCSNNSNPTATQSNISGTYKLTEYTWGAGIPTDLNDDGVFNSNLAKESDCFINNLIIFQSGGSFTSAITSIDQPETNTAGAITSFLCNFPTNSAGTWSDNATNVFTVNVESSGSKTFIKEGNNLRFNYNKNYTLPNGGVLNITYTMLFTKQ